jgi:hypothetical protein
MVTEIFIQVKNVRSFEKYTLGPNALTSTFVDLVILGNCVCEEGNILPIIEGIHFLALGCVAASVICDQRSEEESVSAFLNLSQGSLVWPGSRFPNTLINFPGGSDNYP